MIYPEQSSQFERSLVFLARRAVLNTGTYMRLPWNIDYAITNFAPKIRHTTRSYTDMPSVYNTVITIRLLFLTRNVHGVCNTFIHYTIV